MILRKLFGKSRVVAMVGSKNEGKTNNLIALLKDFRKHNKKTKIYLYGFNEVSLTYLKRLGNVYEVSGLEQLQDKEDSLIICDEIQTLNLGDRRHKERLSLFIDFINHSNNWLLLSSPNPREFNSILGSIVEVWIVKSLRLRDLVRGSQIKERLLGYKGRFRVLDGVRIPKNEILILNDDYEKEVKLQYIQEVDSKRLRKSIFELSKPLNMRSRRSKNG
jgi:hypothetical protein